MPSIKRAGVKSAEVKTGFEPYDGPEPKRRGMYRTKIRQFKYAKFSTGATGYVILGELEAAAGDPKDHAQFDGCPVWARIVFGDKEMMITRENNLYAALGVKDEPSVVFKDGELDSRGLEVTKIGGKNPVGLIVNFDIKPTDSGLDVDGIYKLKEDAAPSKRRGAVVDDEDEDADLYEESDEDEAEEDEDAEEQSREEREEELSGSTIAELKALATSDYDIDIKGLKKAGIIEAILDYEFSDEEEEDDEDEEDEEEDDVEEEEDDEEDDEEEEDDDERAEREAELNNLNRVQLKKILLEVNEDAKVMKRHSDDDIRAMILEAEFGSDDETPF